ncbi:MAG: hypothetical protein WA615_01605 [Bradyrhizobium sp.]|jgi:NAD(P)H-dependent flavin oxidoreductase YrpB (nitropropane dioxygenase family)|uniref:hypothetical protein n=1 Tax=Bradyrhizobium sp. TaxID=376 RepID=UPI003C7DD9BD
MVVAQIRVTYRHLARHTAARNSPPFLPLTDVPMIAAGGIRDGCGMAVAFAPAPKASRWGHGL